MTDPLRAPDTCGATAPWGAVCPSAPGHPLDHDWRVTPKPDGERPCEHPFVRLYRRHDQIVCDACGHSDDRLRYEESRRDALAQPVPDSLDRCPIDGQPALTLSGNCGHSWASRLRDQGAPE